MNFDEMTYFVNDEKRWILLFHREKEKSVCKNYRISNYFSGSKASNRREEEYIKEILCPVLIAVGIPLNQEEQ